MINNQHKFKTIERLRRFLMFLSVICIAVFSYWNKSLPVFAQYLLLAIIIITVLILIYHFVIGFAFFSLEEVGDVLIFKYYKTNDFSFKRMKISISHGDFSGFEIRESVCGLRRDLLLFENINGRKASYPPLNITYLSAAKRQQLILKLQAFS